eukprot:scaffold152013_cov15-Prasinocladus_malaysianus.AAC.1
MRDFACKDIPAGQNAGLGASQHSYESDDLSWERPGRRHAPAIIIRSAIYSRYSSKTLAHDTTDNLVHMSENSSKKTTS